MKKLSIFFLLAFFCSGFHPASARDILMPVNDFPPYYIKPEKHGDEPKGESVYLMRNVIDAYNDKYSAELQLRFTPFLPFARCLKMMEQGEADIMPSLFFSSERAAYMHLFEYKTKTPIVFLVRRGGAAIETFDDLKKLKIGVQFGYNYFPAFDSSDVIDKLPVYTLQDLLNHLTHGRIDAAVFNENLLNAVLNSKPELTKTFRKADYVYDEANPTHIGISKRSPYGTGVYLERFQELFNEMLTKEEFKRVLENHYEAQQSGQTN